MKKIFSLLFATLSVFALTSCVEETFPEGDTATSEQVGSSESALEALLSGIPSQMVQGYYIYDSQTHETDMAYPQFMISTAEMMGDFYPEGSNTGYDWYANYNTFTSSFGENSYYAYIPWYTLYKFVKASNDVISSVDVTDESLATNIKGMAGIAYACRAFYYYLLTVFFEPVDNIYTDCSDVLGLTVPIVTETTDGETSKNNPRVSHDEMIEFMLSDLAIAEECLTDYTPDSQLYPDLSVVYGLMARVYMWDEDYANAATYARKAIDTSGATPMTETQWLDLETGFNTANQAWMWYLTYAAENMGNLCNFIGWVSGEADWGYSSLTCPSIDKSLYDKIADNDFRKYTFLDPDRSFYDYETCRDQEWLDGMNDYLSLKFRCRDGDYTTYSVGGAVDVPVMRVEEMYFIEAEAVGASEGVSAGIALLEDFMQTWRQPDYECTATTLREFQLEVLTQMRIEFWCEFNAFPAAKRLKPDVIQNYEGTNAPADSWKINCEGIKPNWNLVITIYELNSNVALQDYNNPDPTGTVTGPTTIGEFAPGNY